jgi:ubiquinone/menaquinone biosynthesis C-methylase UbiE
LRERADSNSLKVERVFDTFAERYDKWYDEPFGKTAFDLERACIALLCGNLEPGSLEIGVGTGRFAEALKIEYGVDISTSVLRFAKRQKINAIKGTGEKLPFPDKSFGAIFIIVTICFVDEPAKILEETARVLKDNGNVVLGLILKESLWASFYKKKGGAGNVFYKIANFYSIEELTAMIEKSGLKIMETSSTIFQSPTENPLSLEIPRKGYHREAGFVAMKLAKANFSVY